MRLQIVQFAVVISLAVLENNFGWVQIKDVHIKIWYPLDMRNDRISIVVDVLKLKLSNRDNASISIKHAITFLR